MNINHIKRDHFIEQFPYNFPLLHITFHYKIKNKDMPTIH